MPLPLDLNGRASEESVTGKLYLIEEKSIDSWCQDCCYEYESPCGSRKKTGMSVGDRNVPG